jgi:hypothetical protein
MYKYNNAVVYKIKCKIPTITDIYIGSTINFNKRKSVHYENCYNINSNNYMMNLYIFIRRNGGFNNFDFDIIEECPCNDKKELRQRERYYQDLYNPSLCKNRAYTTYTEKLIYVHQYYSANKDYINNYRNEVYNCDHCDKTYTLRNKTTHKKTKYCMTFNKNETNKTCF